MGARPSEVLFTSGGTESDNLAIKGTYWRDGMQIPVGCASWSAWSNTTRSWTALTSCRLHEGAKVTRLEVDHFGRVRPETVRAAIESDPEGVALVSVMWANNEVGTVQPIVEIAALCHEFGIPVHSDAVQAVGQVEVDFAAVGLT